MTAFSGTVRRELQYLKSSKGDRALLLWLPAISALLVWWIFSAGQPLKLPIAVVDQDNSSMSRAIVRMVDAMPGVSVAVRLQDNAEATQLLQQRQVYGVLILPDNLMRNVYQGIGSSVVLQHNAQFASHSSQVVRNVQQAITAYSTGINTERYSKSGQPGTAASSTAMPVQVMASALFNDGPDYEVFLAATLVPALLHIIMMICAVSATGRELRDGTAAQWLETAGSSVLIAVLGKLTPYLLIFALWGLGFIVFFSLRGSAVSGSMAVVMLAMLLFITASLAIGTLLVAASRNFRMGLSLSGLYTAPAFAYSGQAFPLVAMPVFAQWWASILPLTHWLAVYNRVWLAGSPFLFSVTPFLVLLLMTILALTAACYLLKQHAFKPENWGAR